MFSAICGVSRRAKSVRIVLLTTVVLTACGGGGGGSNTVPLSDPNAVTTALTNKITVDGSAADILQGAPPDKSQNPSGSVAPTVIAATTQVVARPGDRISIPLNANGSQTLASLFAKIPGAASYFEAPIDVPGGKQLTASGDARKSLVQAKAEQTVTFGVDVPLNLQTGGQICFEFSVNDIDNLVSDITQACIVVQTPATPAPTSAPTPGPTQSTNDQPPTAQLASALAGSWVGPCFPSDDPADPYSSRFLLSYSGSNAYVQRIEYYEGSNVCSGTPDTAFSFSINGTYAAAEPRFLSQQQAWVRDFDFFPSSIVFDDGETFTPAELQVGPCYNLLRIEGNTSLILGTPNTYSFTGDQPVAGDCSSADTRPAALATEFPYTR